MKPWAQAQGVPDVFTTLHVETGPIMDLATDLEASAKDLNTLAEALFDARGKLATSTTGEASKAATDELLTRIGQIQDQAGELTRNGTAIRKLAELYSRVDLEGARSFG